MEKYSGRKALIYSDVLDPSRAINGSATTTVTTTKDTLYLVTKRGENSILPLASLFFSPFADAAQLTLVVGDQIIPLERNRVCKASADISMEQGTIDVTDDCSGPYGESIIDGVTQISGSLSGFMLYDPVTRELAPATVDMMNRFMETVEDDGAGHITVNPVEEKKMYMFVNLNSTAQDGQKEVWMLMPIEVSSLGSSWGLTEGQNMDLSWSKGVGDAYLYTRQRPAPPPTSTKTAGKSSVKFSAPAPAPVPAT
jgi:hypothetical protein